MDWQYWHWNRPEYAWQLSRLLAEGLEEGTLGGLLLISWAPESDDFSGSELQRILTAAIAPPLPVVHANLESGDPQYTILTLSGVQARDSQETFDRRVGRELVHGLFRSFAALSETYRKADRDKAPEAREAPIEAPLPEDLEEEEVERYRLDEASPRPPRSPRRSRSAREPDEVHLGTSAPAAVAAGERFVARFAAYTEACRSEVRRVFEQEAPSAQPRLDLEKCRWHPGTKVTVRLGAYRVDVANPVQNFTWNGTWQVLRFDATVHTGFVGRAIVLRFDIAVEGLPLLALRPELRLLEDPLREEARTVSFVEARAPRSAFASYARGDRREVLGRVRSLQIFTGIDVFLDCLSIRPGEQWKPKLSSEISARDVFWLFWSRTARASKWVDWEWRTALQTKSLGGIQPHPLEPIELAPPPEELSALEFGSMYEWYLVALRQSWFSRRLRRLWHVWLSVWSALSRMARRRVWAPNP
jgi:hypothetical protein